MQFYGGEIRGIIGDISYDALNLILDLLDEYIELIEQMNEEVQDDRGE